MPLRIHGLATSESSHSLGRTTTGSVYPKAGGSSFTDPTVGVAWLRIPQLPAFPAGASDNGSEAMETTTYSTQTFKDDIAVGYVDSRGLPLRPYPFLFVGKIYDSEAASPEVRIKWSATWNGEAIAIAEEGRDFLAPDPSDSGWSAEAQKMGSPLVTHAPEGPPTVGNERSGSTLKRPIVAACRRYCFVYPDLPVGSSRASWDETVYYGLPGGILPYYADYEGTLARLGMLRPHMHYDSSETNWDARQYVPRRSVFPADQGLRCELGELVLQCDVYASDADGAPLLVSRTLTLNIENEPTELVGTRVTVLELTLPYPSDTPPGISPIFTHFLSLAAPAHSFSLKQYMLPPGYQFMLSGDTWSDRVNGWENVLSISTPLTLEMIFPEADEPFVMPDLGVSIPSYYGGWLDFQIHNTDPSDSEAWELVGDMSDSSGVIPSYPHSTWLQLPNETDPFGLHYANAWLSPDTSGSHENMVTPEMFLVHIIPQEM